MRPTIEYMNARRDGKARSGGIKQAPRVRSKESFDPFCPIRDAVSRMKYATSGAIEQFRFDVYLAADAVPFGNEWVPL